MKDHLKVAGRDEACDIFYADNTKETNTLNNVDKLLKIFINWMEKRNRETIAIFSWTFLSDAFRVNLV